MSTNKVWQIVMTKDEVEGLVCPLVFGWELSRLNVLSVVMSGDYFHHVQLEHIDEVGAYEVKRGLTGMYTARDKAKMSEAIRGLQPKLEEMIDAWFANQPQ